MAVVPEPLRPVDHDVPVKFACPCCGYLTLDSRGDYDICGVCFWEDDGQDDHDADQVRGGPNGRLSLTQARKDFAEDLVGVGVPRRITVQDLLRLIDERRPDE
jgi:hypothetical protein